MNMIAISVDHNHILFEFLIISLREILGQNLPGQTNKSGPDRHALLFIFLFPTPINLFRINFTKYRKAYKN